MPYLRFTRDKRGYESTFVMHAGRRHGRPNQRILYWFRTPPGVRVGRAALDEDAIRAIEEGNPEIAFDWQKMLKIQAGAVAQPATEALPPRRRERRRATSSGHARAEASIAAQNEAGEPAQEAEIEAEAVPIAESEGEPVAADVQGLGTEDLARLKGRYAEMLTRIGQRVADPGKREALRQEAEILNPDAWITPEEVAQGLAEFDARYENLIKKLGGRRRRSRRGGRRRRGHAGRNVPGGTPSPGPGPDPE